MNACRACFHPELRIPVLGLRNSLVATNLLPGPYQAQVPSSDINFQAVSAQTWVNSAAANLIESMNARLRKVTRNRGQFPSEQAALKVLYLAVRNLDSRLDRWGFRAPPTHDRILPAHGHHDAARRLHWPVSKRGAR